MSGNLVALTGLIYLYVACEQAWKGSWPMAATYFGYAFANIGLYMAVR
jgi:hypothetical protein